jgi:hypothetical protein
MADLRIDIASEFTGAKAFKKAANATSNLEKGVKSLGTTLAATFTTRALIGFAKAFAEDDKAAKLLTRSLNNLGLAFADPQVKAFISNLETTFGVVDGKLRPAFQQLLTTTGSVQESQTLLKTALDLSAASGADVVSVASDLSKAYVGQTRALAKYGLGLSQAELKAMTFEEIQAKITKLFGGQAQVAADSYAGSIDKIAVAADNAKEIIGKGLVEALGSAGGNGGLAASLAGIIKLATTVSDLFVGIGRTVAALGAFFAPGLSPKQAFAEYQRVTAAFRLEDQIARRQYGGAAATKYQKEAAALAKKNALNATKQTKAIKEQTALQKAGILFDVEQAGIIAALKGNITEEERKRLELQLAILTGNTTEASKLAGELAKSQGITEGLARYLADFPDARNPFTAWATYLDQIEIKAARIAGVQPTAPISDNPSQTTTAPSIPSVPSFNVPPSIGSTPMGGYSGPGGVGAGGGSFYLGGQKITVEVAVDPSAAAYGITAATINNTANGNQNTLSRNGAFSY